MAVLIRLRFCSSVISEARSALLTTSALRPLSTSVFQPQVFSAKPVTVSALQLKPTLNQQQIVRRSFASKPTKAEIKDRVLAVCKAFDKITADKLTLDSHFINDLGLDSLDHVEIIMAIEDEFGFEIADDHAEKLLTPAKIVQYVADHEDVDE